MCNRYRDEPVLGRRTGLHDEEGLMFIDNPPAFAELLLRMIDELPDDIVSWSVAGDSFVIKKVLVFEGHLHAYYNHSNFSSFVRQLNNYGFRRMKRVPSARSRSAVGSIQGEAGDTTKEWPWEEFSHPLFRRGRRDLLAGINRHRDGERLKRKPVDVQELIMLNSLRADVGALSGDLRTVNGKLENIMSLLSDVAGGQKRTAPEYSIRGAAVGGSGGRGIRFEGRNVVGSSPTPTGDFHGGRDERGGWGRDSDSGMGGGGEYSGARGAPPGYFVGPSVPLGRQPQGAGYHHPFYRPPLQTPSSTKRYPVSPRQVRDGEALLPPAEEAVPRASESASRGPSHQQTPPQLQKYSTRFEKPPQYRGDSFF